MTFRTSNYGAARGLLGVIEILLWLGFVGGVIIAFGAGALASRSFGASSIAAVLPGMAAALPGILLSVLCFIGVVLTQMGKAQVDTADYTYQILDVARKQLKVSEQALAQGQQPPQSFADLALAQCDEKKPEKAPKHAGYSAERAAPSTTTPVTLAPPPIKEWEYRDTMITKSMHGFEVAGRTFETLDSAKQHLDGLALKVTVPG